MAGTGGLSFYMDGIPATMLGRGFVGDAEVSWKFGQDGGGLQVASFSLSLPRNYDHPVLRPLKRVQVKAGPISLGWGTIGDIDRESGRVTVDGMYRRAEKFLSIDNSVGGGTNWVPTTNLLTAVTKAVGRGLPWSLTGTTVPSAALATDVEADQEQAPMYVSDLLTEYCRVNNKVWYVDTNMVPQVVDWPTAVTHALRPGVPTMPTADDGYSSFVAVRYMRDTDPDSGDVTPVRATKTAELVSPTLGVAETWEDITGVGVLADYVSPTPDPGAAIAQSYADAILAARGARFAYTAAVQAFRGQLVTVGNVEPAAWLPLHGRRVRHYGVRDERGQLVMGAFPPEWIVGRCTYKPGEGRVLEPIGLADRTLPKILSDGTSELGLATNLRREGF